MSNVLRHLAMLIVSAALMSDLSAGAGQARVVLQGDDRLKGITAVDVVIDPLRAEAGRCGVRRDALHEVVIQTLRPTGLKATISEKSSSWHHTIYVTVSTVISDGHCASGIVTELMAHVEGVPVADNQRPPTEWSSLLVGQLTLIRHNGIVSSRRSAHAADVRSIVSVHLLAIGTRVMASNQPSK
jgi:hypothetical protein